MREAKMLVTFLLLLFSTREGETQTTQEICTEVAVDVGFVLDSSGSVGSYYQNEKDFIKDIATAFFGRSDKNRAGVVTFSSNAELSISLGQYYRGTHSDHVQAFRNAVDAIRFHNSGTRIDLGLNVAKTLFKYNEAGRDNVQKLLVLLTDGRTGGSPIPIADEMRRSGVMIVVIGIGNNIDVNMLKRIGGTGNYYGASSFTQLVTNEFVNSITKASCETIYLPAKDGKYYKLYNETKTFDSSKTFCKNEGAHLLIGDSLETMEIVRNHYASLSIWLGAQYDSHRGAWFWLDGQPVGSNAEWGSQGPRGNNVCLSAREGRLYHAPCTADHVFVCQKGVSKPDPPVVSYSLQNSWDPTYNLLCEFHRKILTVPSTYEVSWYSSQPSGEMLISTNIISSNQNYSYYSGAYFGYKVYAKVRMWYTNEASTKSEYAVSNTIYLGFETQPSKVTLIEGGPSVELKIRPNSPILCQAYRQYCKMTLFANTLSGNKDVKVNPCYVTFSANETHEWKTITLKAKGDLVYNGVTTRTLDFSFYPDSFVASMWRNHYPMSIKVRRESVSTGRCTSTGDPHIRTFDGLYYDHYHVGDYVLVKSLARDFEIHVRTQKCASVSCNCGVTVKEGNDVLSINMCGAYAAPDIRYLSNREPEHGTWIEQSPNGKTFIIKLASTAFVKFAARPWSNTFYADITVQLPAQDYNRTTGLCGNMDRFQWNDQMDKGGIIRSGCGRQACTAFTESWKLSKAESLFCYNGGEAKCLEMQDRQKNKQGSEESDDQCVHGSFTTTSSPWSVLPIVSNAKKTDQVTKGFKKMVFPGQRDCDAKRNSSTPNDVVVLPEGDTAVSCDDMDVTPTSVPVVPKFPTPSGITESRARTWCRSKIEGSTVYTVCRQKMGNALPVEGFISQCVEDVKILDDLVVGLQSAVEALTSLCEDIVQKNETNPQPILEQICINECSFRGRCDNGSCICDDGFTSEDCSVDTNQVPEIVSSVILCDVRKTPCNKIRVRSMKIVPGAISCGYWSNNGRSFTTKPVELINFAEVAVELHKPDDRKDRYLANTIPMETYVLVLTNNNGQNYSSPGVPVVVYDSKCMVCSNATVRGGVVESRCELKMMHINALPLLLATVVSYITIPSVVSEDPDCFNSKFAPCSCQKREITTEVYAIDQREVEVEYTEYPCDSEQNNNPAARKHIRRGYQCQQLTSVKTLYRSAKGKPIEADVTYSAGCELRCINKDCKINQEKRGQGNGKGSQKKNLDVVCGNEKAPSNSGRSFCKVVVNLLK